MLVSSRSESGLAIALPLALSASLDFGRQVKGDTREKEKINQARNYAVIAPYSAAVSSPDGVDGTAISMSQPAP